MLLKFITTVDIGLIFAFILTFLGSCWFCFCNYGIVEKFSEDSRTDIDI